MTGLETKLNAILNDKLTNLKPENLKKDVTCLGVTGTLEASASSGGVKQFSTVEEMNSSTGNTEGDLAVVYRSEIQNATADSQFQIATFPDTVVLDTAVTGSIDLTYKAVDSSVTFDCTGSLSSSRFMMNCYIDNGSIRMKRIQYTSSDGITYTRTDNNGNPVDFGTEIYYAYPEKWNDVIGKFIQISGSTFEGLFKYSDGSWVLAPTQLTAIADHVYEKEFYGKNGVETGALTTNISNSFADINAEIYDKIQKAYAAMEPRVLTDTDKAIDKNIYFIPVNAQGKLLLDTSNVTNMRAMFNNCTSLTTIPLLNTSNVTNMEFMFGTCRNLTTIPQLDTSSVTSMEFMFGHCTNLTTIPLLDTSKVTNVKNMFSSCTSLTTIPQLDTSKVTNVKNMFRDCTSLSDESLNNILLMCKNATSYTDTKTLAWIGLTSEQAAKCTTLSNYSAFTAAGWTTGY